MRRERKVGPRGREVPGGQPGAAAAGALSPRAAEVAALVLRLGVGGLLVLAGALKLRSPVDFATEIANYQLAPVVAPFLAAVLPVVEVVVGLALALGPRSWRRGAALASLILFGIFEVAVTAARLRGINIDCGCFGTGGGPITSVTVARNALLMGAAAGLLWFEGRRRNP